jgi:hypothetical protein
MQTSTINHGEVLQQIVDQLIRVKVFLPHLVSMIRELRSWQDSKKFKLIFSKETGALIEVQTTSESPKLYGDMNQVLIEEFKSSCFQYCEIIDNELTEFTEHWRLLELPAEIHHELSNVQVGCHSWRARVRKYVILPLERWPSDHHYIPREPYWRENWKTWFPDRVDDCLNLFEAVDPSDRWDRVIRCIQSFIQDVRIAALELNAKVQYEPDGPSGIRRWRWKGQETKGQMSETQDKLARYLWERRERRVEIRSLIGLVVFSKTSKMTQFGDTART